MKHGATRQVARRQRRDFNDNNINSTDSWRTKSSAKLPSFERNQLIYFRESFLSKVSSFLVKLDDYLG